MKIHELATKIENPSFFASSSYEITEETIDNLPLPSIYLNSKNKLDYEAILGVFNRSGEKVLAIVLRIIARDDFEEEFANYFGDINEEVISALYLEDSSENSKAEMVDSYNKLIDKIESSKESIEDIEQVIQTITSL